MSTKTYQIQSIQSIIRAEPLPQALSELPTFEEAFNPDYLRSFFRSINSNPKTPDNLDKSSTHAEDDNQINFALSWSPLKDHMSDDTQLSVAETNATYTSPHREFSLPYQNQTMSFHRSQYGMNYNLKPDMSMNPSDLYTQNMVALTGSNDNKMLPVPYPNQPNDDCLQMINNGSGVPTIRNTIITKKVFLIIKDPIHLRPNLKGDSKRQSSDKDIDKMGEQKMRKSGEGKSKGKGQEQGQRNLKERLRSADNINVNITCSTVANKRRPSYAMSEELFSNKKLKTQKVSNDDFEDFDLNIDRDFKPGYFDILPAVSFDEIINGKFSKINGDLSKGSPKF